MIIFSILIFLVILGVLVTVHEFGHFIAAKKSGIRVIEFAVGMGPKIWKKQKGETLYSIRALPIGGFCSMEEDSEADPNDRRAFPNAKRRRRALVLLAGSAMNLLLGFLILLGINLFQPYEYCWGFTDPVITGVEQQSDDPNWKPQLQAGDRVLRLNGHALYNYQNMKLFVELAHGDTMSFVVERDGQQIVINDMPKTTFLVPVVAGVEQQSDDPDRELLLKDDRIVGLNGQGLYYYRDFLSLFEQVLDDTVSRVVERDGQAVTINDIQKTSFTVGTKPISLYGFNYYYQTSPDSFGGRIVNAWHDTVDNVRYVWVSLGELFGGRAEVTDMMGPVGMAQVVDTQVQAPGATAGQKTVSILNLTALIAINLAVMNLLPIPGLDGSRLLFVAIEGIRRKKLNPKYEGYVHGVGLVLLFGFMIFIFFNDIVRWITGGPIL